MEIVRLLLHDYDVCRHLTDRQGLTAYELIQTDQMRQLFARPSSSRNPFCTTEEHSTTFSVVSEDPETPTFERVQRCNAFQVLWKHHVHRVVSNHQCPKQLVYDHTPCHRWMDDVKSKQTAVLLTTIEQHVCSATEQPKAKALLKQFSESGRAEPLFQLYTLGTSFYEHVNRSKELSETLIAAIDNVRAFPNERAFKGCSFGGVLLTSEDIEVYQWAENNSNRYIATNTFSSSAKDKCVALAFAGEQVIGQRQPVLMVLEFDEECRSAVQLEKLSNKPLVYQLLKTSARF